jgi:phospholipid/cholesterol/gamma-HCH transport system ATP-binding protein
MLFMASKQDKPVYQDGQEAVVSIHGLYKSFAGNQVLKGIDLELHRGENVVVLGRSGSGKSVLIKIIAGLLKPDQGIVNVFGQQVDKLDKKELMALRLRIGFLFQQGALYDSMTIEENLAFPLVRNKKHIPEKEVAKAIHEVLDAVGLENTVKKLPSQLSGGQQKRIAMARVLILKPEIILYDEPTTGLDPLTSIEINSLIKEVQTRYNTSSILITHDLTCAKQTGDRIVMLIDGKITRQGTFEEVFDTNDEHIKGFYDYNFIQ